MGFQLPDLDNNEPKSVQNVVGVYKNKIGVSSLSDKEQVVKEETMQVLESIKGVSHEDDISYENIKSDNIVFLMKSLSKEIYYNDDLETLQELSKFCVHLQGMLKLKISLSSIKNKLKIE